MAIVPIGNRKVYSFKSVGQDAAERKKFRAEQISARNKTAFGIKTPVQLSTGGTEFLKMNYSMADQVSDNFRNLILINHGERLGFPDFGANLMELAFELQSEDGQQEAVHRISKAAGKYMPYLIPNTFEAIVDHFDNQTVAKVGLRISYDIPKLKVSNRILEVIIYTAS